MNKVLVNEDDFFEYCPCALDILNLANSKSKDGIPWVFSKCYSNPKDNIYNTFFTSFITEEFDNYSLLIEAIKLSDGYNIRVVHEIKNDKHGNSTNRSASIDSD